MQDYWGISTYLDKERKQERRSELCTVVEVDYTIQLCRVLFCFQVVFFGSKHFPQYHNYKCHKKSERIFSLDATSPSKLGGQWGLNLPFTTVRPKKCNSLIPRSSATRLRTSCPVDFGWSRWKDKQVCIQHTFMSTEHVVEPKVALICRTLVVSNEKR